MTKHRAGFQKINADARGTENMPLAEKLAKMAENKAIRLARDASMLEAWARGEIEAIKLQPRSVWRKL